MLFTVSVRVDRPLQHVVDLLTDPAHLPMWLRGLEVHEPLDGGVHGRPGTRSRVVLRTGKQSMEATETITRLEPDDLDALPADAVVRYEREIVADGMWSSARERLEADGPGATLWVSENEYRFDSAAMRVMSRVMRRSFEKQTLGHMRDFAAFAEDGTDVRTT